MNDDEVIHRSVQDFRLSLDSPVVRRIINRLLDKFPGVQRATVEEMFVKTDFNESDTENRLRSLFPCSQPSETESQISASINPTRITVTNPSASEPGLSLQEIQEEEEALRRSVEDQRSKLQSLANQLSLCRLKSQFPDIQLVELENLLIRFDLNEQELVKHLVDRGFSCRPVAPLIPATEDTERDLTPSFDSMRLSQASTDLAVLNAQLSVIRGRIGEIRQRLFKRVEKGVASYYSDELGRLYREQRDLSLARAQRLTEERSINFERDLLANGESASVAASKAFAYIDLHGLDKSCAMTVLKQRIQLLEAHLQLPGRMSSRVCVIVITGRGGNAESDLITTSPILRPAVISYFNANQYPFQEKYTTGSGYFTVTVHRRQ
ncbi:unnamed protein product [Echinostoma caproni]|uniref:Smr domain-containing protein n=1 Tax=Echinostoma caproni TaxID=27848 RepID=A0A183AZF5_9TREM|nr:unnamed protein product [Echinostoma caproni]